MTHKYKEIIQNSSCTKLLTVTMKHSSERFGGLIYKKKKHLHSTTVDPNKDSS